MDHGTHILDGSIRHGSMRGVRGRIELTAVSHEPVPSTLECCVQGQCSWRLFTKLPS